MSKSTKFSSLMLNYLGYVPWLHVGDRADGLLKKLSLEINKSRWRRSGLQRYPRVRMASDDLEALN